MAIRLKDIARELNVSVITVSKALRGNTDISDATRERILTRMKELDYQPNLTARSLATGQSFIVGLIVPDLLNPFFTELAKTLGTALRRHGYGLILASSDDMPEIERTEIRMMFARGVDALLLASCQPNLDGLDGSNAGETPVVLVDRPYQGVRACFAGTDDYAGGRMATEHLIGLGRRRLAYIGSPDVSAAAERFRGFRMALEDHGIALRGEFVIASAAAGEADDNEGYMMMATLLTRRSRPDGVFCHNDVVAIGAMKATLDAGLTIPGDVAFVGFDNVQYSRYLQIPLTSVDQSTGKLGEAVVQLVLDRIAGKTDQAQTVLLAPTLVVRQSSVGASPDARPVPRIATATAKTRSMRSRKAVGTAR